MIARAYFIFILCLIIIAVFIVFHQLSWLKPIEGASLKVLSPIGSFFYNIGKKTHDFFVFLSSQRNLEKQNQILQEKVKKLLVENVKLKETERENEILRKQLDFVKSFKHKLISAQIIAFDPSGLFQFITISKGEKDGVKVGMPVVISGGILVGKIKEVTLDTSKVLLITDPSSSIPALIQENRAKGIIKGQMKLGLILEMIPLDVEVKIGDTVLTSSFNNEVEGLLIGQVIDVQKRQGELFQKIQVKPACDFKKLELVSVILE